MAQSYAKNMGLYGERVGALSIVSSLYVFIFNQMLQFKWYFSLSVQCQHIHIDPVPLSFPSLFLNYFSTFYLFPLS